MLLLPVTNHFEVASFAVDLIQIYVPCSSGCAESALLDQWAFTSRGPGCEHWDTVVSAGLVSEDRQSYRKAQGHWKMRCKVGR